MTIEPDLQIKLEKAADAAARVIVKLEPALEHFSDRTSLVLRIQEDSCGQMGDVRNVLAIKDMHGWKIDFSVKHNHSAIKHSRLSANIDFDDKWLSSPVSQQYFKAIKPIFEELALLKLKHIKWKQLNNKTQDCYAPILTAFSTELASLDLQHPVKYRADC